MSSIQRTLSSECIAYYYHSGSWKVLKYRRVPFEDYQFHEQGKKDNSWKQFSQNYICSVCHLFQYMCATSPSYVHIYTQLEKSWQEEHMEERFSVDSAMRMCIHICGQEFGSFHDPYAVSIVHEDNVIVGHVPQTILALCYFSKKWNNFIPSKRETMPFHRFATRRDGGTLYFDIQEQLNTSKSSRSL